MMKIRILSDLHLEHAGFEPPTAQADVVVLAGDVSIEDHGLEWARRAFSDMPIVYVVGNHEFYHGKYETVLERCRKRAAELDIHLLEKDEVVLNGVRFLGTTLWTDFALEEAAGYLASMAMRYAGANMNDFRLIQYRGGILSPLATRCFHLESRQWLADQLAEPFDGRTVVITHHLPHRGSIDRAYHGSLLNPAFASHLPELVRPPVSLWVHGHTHKPCDYEVDGTRVVCNPRGYPRETGAGFDPALVIEI